MKWTWTKHGEGKGWKSEVSPILEAVSTEHWNLVVDHIVNEHMGHLSRLRRNVDIIEQALKLRRV